MVASQAQHTCSPEPHTTQLPRKGEELLEQLELHPTAALDKSNETGSSQGLLALTLLHGHHVLMMSGLHIQFAWH
jgi:hypothetical protein